MSYIHGLASEVGSHRPISAHMPEIFGPGATVSLPTLDAGPLLEEDAARPQGGVQQRMGVVQPVTIDSRFDGIWTGLPDGRWVWALELHSDGAVGIRARIEEWTPPAGTSLHVWEPGHLETVQRPLTSERASPRAPAWAPTIWGDRLRLEMVVPAGFELIPDRAFVRIDEVLLCYRSPDGRTSPTGTPGRGTALSCHLDWTCYPAYSDEGQAVGLYHFIGDGFSFICSGFLLNRNNADFTPIFGTAWHCGVRQSNVQTMEVYWRYETPSCNGTPPSVNTLARSNGVVALVTDNDHDWSLIGLDGQAGGYFLGWDSGVLGDNSPTYQIHHPKGTFKKITFMTRTATVQSCIGGSVANGAYRNRIDDGDGEIEPGSSGGPLLDENDRVRGTGSCASWACNQQDVATHGRFDRAFDDLQPWLQPSTSVWVDESWGGTERGTLLLPFDLFFDGVFGVLEGGVVNIEPGSYSGTGMTIDKAMTLRASGGSVFIGP